MVKPPEYILDYRGRVLSINPNNQQVDSYQQLQNARRDIADVRERNKNTNSKKSSLNNPVERRIWNDCQKAAKKAEGNYNLPKDVDHFFIRQRGKGMQKPWWAEGKDPYKSYGPFINNGGGDVPGGNETYIDFYQGVK